MTEHVTAWLDAYHDGELRGRQLRRVEAHLAHCATCRAELERRRALAALLQESPPARDVTPPDRFVAQVGLRLPRRPAQPAWRRALEMGWRLAPLGLLGAWAFIQAVFLVAGLATVAVNLGLGGDLVAGWLTAPHTGPGLAELFSAPDAGLSDVARAVRLVWEGGERWGLSLTLYLASMAAIGLLYGSWLASWWARRHAHTQ